MFLSIILKIPYIKQIQKPTEISANPHLSFFNKKHFIGDILYIAETKTLHSRMKFHVFYEIRA